MKKTNFVSLILFIGIIFLLIGCASTTAINDEHIVPPDPNNPYQGTWLSMGTQNMMYVIKGMNAAGYALVRIYGVPYWREIAVYAVNETWSLSEDGNILTVGGIRYERYEIPPK